MELINSMNHKSDVMIVSIVDYTSTLSTMVKLHSIIRSTRSPQRLHFKFLIINEKNAVNCSEWNTVLNSIYPNMKYESKVWTNPITFPKLRDSRFEKTYIYARFYIPQIFPDVLKYVYLDNDLVVTGDICELFDTPLVVSHFKHINEKPTTNNMNSMQLRQNMLNNIGSGTMNRKIPKQIVDIEPVSDDRAIELSNEMSRKPPPPSSFQPVIGFVYDRHTDYNKYINYHFNITHPLVMNAKSKLLSSLFLNGGVMLVNALLWRERNITTQVEAIIQLNQEMFIYDTATGDQGIFYILFHHEVCYLPAKWNMRRLPMKTVHMLYNGVTGIYI